MFKMACT